MKNLMHFSTMGILVITANLVTGCAKEANPTVGLNFSTYTAQNWFWKAVLPSAHAAMSNGKLCFKRLRFKKSGETTSATVAQDSSNIDFTPGEVSITTTGTSLGQVSIPAGTYTRIEFDLEKNCPGSASGNSVSFTNNNGNFFSDQTITIRFEGSFEANKSGQMVNLNAQAIVSAMNTVMSISDVKTNLEAVSVKGSF